MFELKSSQLYLWKRHSINILPWQRQYVNVDFLNYEKKRINDAGKWYDQFTKAAYYTKLDEVTFYASPVELNSEWKASIQVKGPYYFTGLSALRNCHNIQLIMIFPKDLPIPEEYSLIRITKARKDYIHNEKTNIVYPIILVEEYDKLDSSQVYLDVPYDKRSVLKFIQENLIADDNADYLQPTISGAPYRINDIGGISYSAFMKNNTFSEEFIKTLKIMQPPEFTDIQYHIPKRLSTGNIFSPVYGIRFRVAERYVPGNNYYNAFSSEGIGLLNQEILKRKQTAGEYSFACSVTNRGLKPSEWIREILSKFVQTEIMRPFPKDELKLSDVDLSRTQSAISEDLWIQIANQRQHKPSINIETSDLERLRKSVFDQWEIIMQSANLKKQIDHEHRIYAARSYENILKVCQGIARDENKDIVDGSIIRKSFEIFVNNAENLMFNNEVIHKARQYEPEQWENKRFNAVRAELSGNQPIEMAQLYDNLKGYFKDLYVLQAYIDKLKKSGFLYEPRRNYYKWL